MKYIFQCVFFLVVFNAYSQFTIQGHILDSLTNNPIEGATVFFDQTSIWTITDSEGYFNLYMKLKTSTPLVISFLGYERIVIPEPFTGEELTVHLKRAENELEAVIIKSDRRNKDKKANQLPESNQLDRWSVLFDHLFIGPGRAANRRRLSNSENIHYSFNAEQQTLSVSSKTPLVVVNNYLKYRIIYTLDTASINFYRDEKFNVLVPRIFMIA